MNKRIFGNTGINIPEVGMGCWAIGGTGYGPVSEVDAMQTLETAWESGVRFFDTADTYGEGLSEQRLGAFLKSKPREKYFLATKAGWDFYHGGHKKNFDPDYLKFACDKSIERLGVECIDLYQLHNPSLDILKKGEAIQALLKLKEDGKIRFLGLSLHTTTEAMWALEHLPIDSIQIIYNILDQRMRHDVFPLALQKQVAVIAREPLACGLLTGKYGAEHVFQKSDHRRRYSRDKMTADLAKIRKVKGFLGEMSLIEGSLQFILGHKAVSCVIPGAKSREQFLHISKIVDSCEIETMLLVELQQLFDNDLMFKKELIPADS